MKFNAVRKPLRVTLLLTTSAAVLGLGFAKPPLGQRAASTYAVQAVRRSAQAKSLLSLTPAPTPTIPAGRSAMAPIPVPKPTATPVVKAKTPVVRATAPVVTSTTPAIMSAPLASTVIVAASSGGLRIGLSYGDTLPGLSRTALAQTLDDAVALGTRWIRVDLAWSDVQYQSAGSYDWSGFDRVVHAARARNLGVLPILAYTPAWARPAGCDSDKCAPADANAFASFAAAATRRYAPQGVHSWEIWNEPNIGGFWQPAPDIAQYVGLVRAVVPAIKGTDSAATVVSGGLAPAPSSGGDISQIDYLTGFSNLGGPQLVDAIGYHPYSFPVPPAYDADWNAWAQIAATPRSFQSVLAAHGYAGKKIWITEYGAPTNGPGLGATASDYKVIATPGPDHVDEALQAQMATDSVGLAKSSSTIVALFWYSYRDLGTGTSTIENFFGLRRYDGSPKPAYAALKQAIATKP
jgi:polysaccharide biosynthesis protein PslG